MISWPFSAGGWQTSTKICGGCRLGHGNFNHDFLSPFAPHSDRQATSTGIRNPVGLHPLLFLASAQYRQPWPHRPAAPPISGRQLHTGPNRIGIKVGLALVEALQLTRQVNA
jgi:hypothetical protein